MSGIYVRQDGDWKPVETVYLKQSGTWQPVETVHVKQTGSWRIAYKRAFRFEATLTGKRTNYNLADYRSRRGKTSGRGGRGRRLGQAGSTGQQTDFSQTNPGRYGKPGGPAGKAVIGSRFVTWTRRGDVRGALAQEKQT